MQEIAATMLDRESLTKANEDLNLEKRHLERKVAEVDANRMELAAQNVGMHQSCFSGFTSVGVFSACFQCCLLFIFG